MLRYRTRIKGFSLLELIIAIAILSVGIVVALQAISYSLRLAGLSCDYVSAAFLAEDKLQELEYKEKNQQIDTVAREAEESQDKFRWKRSIALDSALNLYKLNFAINWTKQNRQEGFEVDTYLRK